MRLLVLGAGLMGPAAAYNALLDEEVTRVTLADRDPLQLESAREHLASIVDVARFHTVILDLSDRDLASNLIKEHDVVLAALPWSVSVLALNAAFDAKVPFVDLAIPEVEDI